MIYKTQLKLPWWSSTLLSILSGILIVLSMPKYDLFFLAWIAFVPLLAVVASPEKKLKSVFLHGWITGIVTHMGGFVWLDSTIVRFGNIHPALAFAIFLFFGLVSGLSLGFVALMTRVLLNRKVPLALSLAISLVIVESFFPHLFPWFIAMSHWRFPIAFQTAELWGVAGISGILALINGVIFEKIAADAGWLVKTRTMRRISGIVAAGVCLLLIYGAVRMEMIEARSRSLPSIKVGIIQPNISIEEKKTPSFAMKNLWMIQSLSSNLEQRRAGLIIWPETSYPFRIPREQKTDFEGMRKISHHNTVPILVGAVSYGSGRYYNSAFLVTPDEKLIGPSDKNNLVLFGEYNPLYDVIPESIKIKYPKVTKRGMTPGDEPVILEYGKLRLGVLNCLEDILSNYTTQVTRAGANILVNITNDAWFGDTAEPYQHLALAVFRTVENRRELVRSVNTGVSAVVDLSGKIRYMSETFRQEYVVVDVHLSDLKTPYQATGNLLRWLCVGLFIIILIAGKIRGRK